MTKKRGEGNIGEPAFEPQPAEGKWTRIEPSTTAEEKLAWDYLVKDHPWVAKDEYYKKNPTKCMTFNAYLAGYRARDAEISALRHDLTRFKDICAGHETTLAALQKQNEGLREVLVDMASHADEGGCEGYFGTKAREALAAADESEGTNG